MEDENAWILAIFQKCNSTLAAMWVQAVRDAYMPQGKRKEQYLAIYKDILLKNTEVCEYILYLRKLKEVKNNSGSAPAPHRANITTICRSAHGRWKVAMAAGGGIGE